MNNIEKAKQFYNQAIDFYENGDYENAKLNFGKAIEIDSLNSKTYFNLSVLLTEHFQEYEKAKLYYKKAIELNPTFVDAYFNLAVLLSEHFKEYEKAKYYFEKTIEIKPDFEAYYKIAILYYRIFNNKEKAQQYFLEAINIKPTIHIEKPINELLEIKETFISNIYIKNIFHLNSIKINIDTEKKHLFITGKNGSGKTSVLKEMENELQNILEMPINNLFEELEKSKLLNKKSYNLKIGFIDNFLDLRLKYETNNFEVVFLNDERKFNPAIPNFIENINLKTKYLPKINVSKDFIKYLIHRDYMMKSNQKKDNIEELFEKILEILKSVFNEKDLEINIEVEKLNIYIKLPNRPKFNFNQLASGYSAILKIIFELLLRVERKPNKSNTEGIVMIDEPEVHLHIELQKKIMPMLIKMFPNIQFIVATHSPFILNSISNAVVYDLEKQIRTNDFSTISYSGIVEYYYNEKEFSNIMSNKSECYLQLVEKFEQGNLSEQEEIELAELDIKLGELSPILSTDIYSKYRTAHKKLEE